MGIEELKKYLMDAVELEAYVYKCNQRLKNIRISMETADKIKGRFGWLIPKEEDASVLEKQYEGVEKEMTFQARIDKGEIIDLSIEEERTDRPVYCQMQEPKYQFVLSKAQYSSRMMDKEHPIMYAFHIVFLIIAACLVGTAGIACMFVGILWNIELIITFIRISVFLVIVSLLMYIFMKQKCKKNYRIYYQNITYQNQKQKDEFEKEKAKKWQEYKQKSFEWDKQNIKIKENNEEKKRMLQELQVIKIDLEKELEWAKQRLEAFYDANVIFPKYRDFVAVSSIYEYFDSGICVELGGAYGAYSRYEEEVRAKLVLTHLTIIANQLEAIKKNQYQLYRKMNDISNTLEKSHTIVRDINNTLYEIEDSTRKTEAINAAISEYTKEIQRDMQIIRKLEVYNANHD